MSWLFSQALVAAYSAENSWDGTPSAPSNGTPTPLLYCAPDRTTEFFRLSRFGMTFRPSTDVPGEAVLTWFLAGFPARTSAPPAKAPESTESEAECGDTWLGSLARYDHDSRSWKTPQCSLLEGLDEFSETWPRWGMMRDGACWALSTLEHRTSENASGLFPTPSATQEMNGGEGAREMLIKLVEAGRLNPFEAEAMAGRKLFSTPTCRDHKGGYRTEALIRKDGKSRALDALPNAVLGGLGVETQNGGSLNPTWVEWLMGWPLGWTDCAASATDKFQQWQLSHGEYLEARKAA